MIQTFFSNIFGAPKMSLDSPINPNLQVLVLLKEEKKYLEKMKHSSNVLSVQIIDFVAVVPRTVMFPTALIELDWLIQPKKPRRFLFIASQQLKEICYVFSTFYI